MEEVIYTWKSLTVNGILETTVTWGAWSFGVEPHEKTVSLQFFLGFLEFKPQNSAHPNSLEFLASPVNNIALRAVSPNTARKRSTTSNNLSSTNIRKLVDDVRCRLPIGSYLEFTRSVEQELTKILHDTELCRHFRDFLKSKRCEENLYFWIEVELMKNEAVTPKEKLSDTAKRIYSKYIADKSPHQVSIEYNYTEAIHNKMKTQNISRDMFTGAQKAVFRLMAASWVMNFAMPAEVHIIYVLTCA